MNTVVGHSSLVVGKTAILSGLAPVSTGVRAITALTACVTAVTGIPIVSFLAPIISAISMIGVLLARRFPSHGKHLMWFGAAMTSLWSVPFGGGILRISLTAGGSDPRLVISIAASLALVIACDVALIADALGQRLTTNDQRRI
jgi:hypothetical protein